jgi:preprotein translocase subunit Sec63
VTWSVLNKSILLIEVCCVVLFCVAAIAFSIVLGRVGLTWDILLPEVKTELSNAKRALKIALRKDYYKILGITDKTCTDHQIRKAYKKAALQWHPGKIYFTTSHF